MMTDKQLLSLKENIEEAKNTVNRLNGQLDMLEKELQTTWGCTTVEDAEKLLIKMQKDMDALDVKIAEGKEELEEKYGKFIN